MKFADLQLHTIYSDGTYTPATLVAAAKDTGLACIALTDHDTVDGIEETSHLSRDAGIEFIPGVELTAYIGHDPTLPDSREVHILGYFIDCQDRAFRHHLTIFKQAREERLDKIIAKLNALNIPLRREQVTFLADPRSSLGRLHIARALKENGFVTSTDDAFARYLGKGQPAWAPKFRVSVKEAAHIIHQAGGIAIFAHPGIARAGEQIFDLLRDGLDGIEVWHSKHTPEQSRRYKAIAEQLGCLITGGSDCHGSAKEQGLIGNVKLPYEYVERLREAACKRRKQRM